MSARPAKKKDAQPLTPAPSVLDAVNASRDSRGLAPVAPQKPAAEDDVDVALASEAGQTDPEPVAAESAAASDTASVTAQLRARREASEATLATPVRPAPKLPAPAMPAPALPQASTSVDDLGHYVTKVMLDARSAASEFLASVDADAARRAATVSTQAAIEAQSVLDAAQADADKIRADARLEADRLVAERLRVAVELTDQLYGQAEQILADADRPDVARRNLARFITALTQTAEDAAAASVAGTAVQAPSRRTARG
ncbi:hypothetical protein [Aeromicrobium stalagmiti]|uniref:hypothetical protein n=1 Tax=Aeromicrobium stalagmiti TaxID=2738988 RepID=UPI0015692202|nr:hypothetical protein [Aeromicrobium stalagmiti]NRQ48278.1 hypothetical protein [Aeromicrobium stalagmiti]